MPTPSSNRTASSEADFAECRALMKGGSKSFFAASLLLPNSVCKPATALYAFCRLADDAVDEGGGIDALEGLLDRLDRIYAGNPAPIAADREFAQVVAFYGIPKTLPAALIEGFEWDGLGRRYETLSDLNAYATRVAGTVGAMMTMLMGVREPDAVARACDLGIAMQFTNIARDVGEDARRGRIYLPLSWMREEGIDPDAWLKDPKFDKALGRVVKRLLKAADELYVRSEAGVAALPPACRGAIHAARFLYAEIGHKVRRRGYDSVTGRAVVPLYHKLWLLLTKIVLSDFIPTHRVVAPPVEEARFLVDAVAAIPDWPEASKGKIRPPIRWWSFTDRAIWVLDLFEQLERRDQLQRR
ncbi:phytoene/squalene synthase family protein [Magnetospirillum fulvum]|uniref:Phytoene synthase n=1 Tax=Magnetospirillum fulvum MGU-K5 TaxID=1316936 RepID=S9TYC8_MAGFU|nr:phytoene/squalene synthase family protein [Magnetospirillum fulvum]EPY03355.1 phytoene synthase [Magnetospirillum fulvum MGU-K5]